MLFSQLTDNLGTEAQVETVFCNSFVFQSDYQRQPILQTS